MKKEVKDLIAKANGLLANPEQAKKDELGDILSQIVGVLDSEDKKPWWVIVLKVIAYAIGLILAGYGTTAAAMTLNAVL